MLNRLSIKNYALIDSADILPGKGLNILTGETGAGKSIIMGGLSLILGQRAEGRFFFNQDRKCIIEGYFDISGYDLKSFFAEHDLDYEAETILRREINVDGKSRAFVNDTPVTLQVLKALGERLIDIHSQHATLQINTAAFQLLVLDSVSNNGSLKQRYASVYREWRAVEARLQALREAADRASAEADYHQFLFNELEEARLERGEQQALEDEQKQLEHAEEIKRSLLGATYVLQEQDGSVEQLLRASLQQLQQAARYLPSLEEQVSRLQSVAIEVRDLADGMAQAEQQIVHDGERLEAVNERLSLLYGLQQKHRLADVDSLIALRETLSEKLLESDTRQEEIKQLERQVAALEKEARALAAELSDSRKRVVPDIIKRVLAILRTVGMPDSTLAIQLNPVADGLLRPSGGDEVAFLFSANKGQAPQPVSKVASGGELSRLMLAIKSIVARSSALPTIIFDEIDTGISGEVALNVGETMEALAEHMQVIAITHLPQIAAKGNTHFKVYKATGDDKARTQIARLDDKARVDEIAQMLGGANPGDAAVRHAAELLRL